MSTPNAAAAAGIISRAVRTPWYHFHYWENIEPYETRWHPVQSTEYAVLLEYQKKVFCSCGCITWKRTWSPKHETFERWELTK
jgi:hypothetical protein